MRLNRLNFKLHHRLSYEVFFLKKKNPNCHLDPTLDLKLFRAYFSICLPVYHMTAVAGIIRFP